MTFTRQKTAGALLGLAATAALLLSGCAGPTTGAPAGGADAGGSDRGAPTDIQEFTEYAENIVTEASAEQAKTAPTTGPEIVAGKKIAVIPCSMAAEGCSRPADGAVHAAQAAGGPPTFWIRAVTPPRPLH